MKFHRFPHLVQRELCSLLHPFGLVLLSFCSDRTRKAVQKAIGKQKNEIWVSGSRSAISIYYRNMDKFDPLCSVTRERLSVSRRLICIKIDRVDVGISWKIEPRRSCSINVHFNRHIMLMYKYICYLFNASEEIYLKTDRLECDFPSVNRSHLQNSEFTIAQLGQFYRFHPDQEFSEVKCKVPFNYSFSDLENVFVVRNLILRGAISSVLKCFRLFSGEHAYFEDTTMSAFEIIHISNLWMMREDDELKSMIFKPKEKYDIEEMKAKMKEISGGNERKQEIYPYKSIITQYQKFPSNIFDCTDGIDIRRDIDGKMATITVFPDYVTFFVWD